MRYLAFLLVLLLLGSGSRKAFGSHPDATVAPDGTAQYRRVREAIDASPQTGDPDHPWVILIKPGVYRELVYVQREKRFLRLVGEDAATTVLSWNLYASLPGRDGKPIGTFHTASVEIDADDFSAENLTFANTAGKVGQAVAVRVDGDRVAFRQCRFLGWQDTLLANRGRQYFDRCTIAGAIDFIFGGAAAYFDHCRIVCLGRGYITAPSTPREQPFGFVFADCAIESGGGGAPIFLGRPWRPYGSTLYVRTEMGSVVRPAGWDNWRDPAREKTARFGEFASRGPGADPAGRVPWARRLGASEAAALTIPHVLGAPDHWQPDRSFQSAARTGGG